MAGRSRPDQPPLLREMTSNSSWSSRRSPPGAIGSAGTSCRLTPTAPKVNTPSPSGRRRPMDEVLYACRFVQFTAAMAVFGASSFQFYALAGGHASAAPNILAGFDAWLGRVTLATAIVALVSAFALLLCQAAAMAGSPAAAIDPETLTAVLFETRFGRVWLWHLLLAILLVSACLGRLRGRQPIVLIFSLLLLASLVGLATPLWTRALPASPTNSIRACT